MKATIDRDTLRDFAEDYLKSLISSVTDSLPSNFDSRAPFREMGIDSFRVLKILRALEADFGTLPKSLLFENFTLGDLATYFVDKHTETLATMQRSRSQPHHATAGAPRVAIDAGESGPIRMLEKDALAHPTLQRVVRTLFDRYKNEGSVSLGTRRIAPNLFIGSARRGYVHYGRSGNIILVYGYTGPQDYAPALIEEVYRYCEANGFQLNVLAAEPLADVAGRAFSATPFGAFQRIVDLQEFGLEGRGMRRLRYQVARFAKSGRCGTTEYRCGSSPETDAGIATIIDQWCAARTMVNPLVHDVKRDILAGTLAREHRLFLTHLDDVLQNVILITALADQEHGYLMDLEFYPPDMPAGGLEFAIVEIIKVLIGEGCDVLSLGGTFGCKLAPSDSADAEIDKILDDLRAHDIFNDTGNLQFKNKFRPENKTIFLCRPVGSGNPENVTDIIMMIADPAATQTSDAEHHHVELPRHEAAACADDPRPARTASPEIRSAAARTADHDRHREHVLSQFGFNPLNIPSEHVDFDLKTDSWAQLETPAIQAHMRHLRAQLHEPASIEASLKEVFPFAHCVLTGSGSAAERLFFKVWPQKGTVLQNLLFPSTLFHQIDNGFSPGEAPHPTAFQLDANEPWKAHVHWERFQAELTRDPSAVALACIELADNAVGGQPVSLGHLRKVRELLSAHAIPLVIDATRVLENAQLLIEHGEAAGQDIRTVARELLACADVVIGSLTKDFCVTTGGIVATNDVKLAERLHRLLDEDGGGLDAIERQLVARALANRAPIEVKVRRRIDVVRRLWTALVENDVPVVRPAGGHSVLIDVKRIPEFTDFKYPVASFLAWLYATTGIRAAAHSVGMQRGTSLNDLVRLALPIGLDERAAASIIERLVRAFAERINILELTLDGSAPPSPGNVHANYALVRHDRVPATSSPPSRPNAAAPTVSERDRRPVPSHEWSDVAVVGMAGRYPKASNVAELWQNLAAGRDCIEEIPAQRHAWRLHHGSAARYRGGFIDDVDRFDSLFFNISPREAEMLDPQERLFLEVAWEALEDAGYDPETLVRADGSRNVGVFVGAVWTMYQLLGVEEKHAGNSVVPNSFLWSIANRVSYCFNLSGPSLTIDTACSSSLTAIYLACEAIRAGKCSAAIVGGANLDLHQAKLDINSMGGALSPDGVCRAFGKGANGYVAGEGVGALLLKPLERAELDGDRIYGVIKAAVVNHGGRSSGYTVPNPRLQTDLIVSALEAAKVDARTIGYIEAHGTGTALGDPIEISALSNAFESAEPHTCAIGSVKTNIGHLEAAAGIVGVTKVLLQMQHRRIVPSLHSSELNEFIDFTSSPFYVPQQTEDWRPRVVDGVHSPRRAGVSSFGAGGANAHVIVEEYEPKPAGPSTMDPREVREVIVPISAASGEQLLQAAARLAAFVDQNDTALNDIAHTLQVGRKSFDHRLAIIAKTKDELLAKLGRFVAGQRTEGVTSGHVTNAVAITRLLNRREKEEFARLLLQDGDVHKIAALWTEGLLDDWSGYRASGPGKRVSLPTYPFADRRHWAHERSAARRSSTVVTGIHPLIDSNESTFERQIFKKTFSARDFVIDDHHVSGVATLPGVAYLELARQAGELAAQRKVQRIRNVVWVSPITIEPSTSREVFIELKPNNAAVRFEVFSHGEAGQRVLHSQGTLLYATSEEADAKPEYVDLAALRARCVQVADKAAVYPLFSSLGLQLGPSFQVVREVYRNASETLGVLQLPETREADLQQMVLHPSLVDGSLQAGVAAQLTGKAGEVVVPFSIGEVEILCPLAPRCFSYVTDAKANTSRTAASTVKSNVLILDEAGKILVRILESTGVPLRELQGKSQDAGRDDDFRRLYYTYDWELAPASDETTLAELPRSILLCAPEQWQDACRHRLRQAGGPADDVVFVRAADAFADLGEGQYGVNPASEADFTHLFDVLSERHAPIEAIVFAWPCSDPDPDDEGALRRALASGVYAFAALCKALVKRTLEREVPLLYVYSGTAGRGKPHHEAVTGFCKTVQQESPKLLCKVVEVQDASVEDVLDAAIAELQRRRPGVTAVRHDAQGRWVRRLHACDLDTPVASVKEGASLRERGVYLITGGAGGLGLMFAAYLAREHSARLVLTGRSTRSVERDPEFQVLRDAGADVLYVAADVSRHDEVEALIGAAKDRFGEINGIIHAAGVTRDALLGNKSLEDMDAVLAPKVFGTVHLDTLTKDEDLDFFVAFSSLAALSGNLAQSDYSFANHFMDSFLAERERLRAAGARSGKTLTLNWSLWAVGGMRIDEQTERYIRKTRGSRPLSEATGLDAFVRALASGHSQVVVVEGIPEIAEVVLGVRERPAPATAAPASPSVTLAALDTGANLVASLQNDLSHIVMRLLKVEASDVPSDKILLDLGFDSLSLTGFANAINEQYGLDLTPVLFFDYPSIGEIAKYLCDESADKIHRFYDRVAPPTERAIAAPSTPPHAVTISKGWNPAGLDRDRMTPTSSAIRLREGRFIDRPIAIVGMSGVMPESEDLDEFWHNLAQGRDLITVIPPDRWRWEDYDGDPLKEPNKSYSRWGGFMKEIDTFDPLFFGISPREARMMDPQQRIFLQQVWKAIEDSGQKVSDLSGTKTGLFVGVATNDYIDVMHREHVVLDGYSASGNSHSVLANRVSFLLNLRGPSAPIDTACSSSLVALHRAIESIHTGSCDMAIVGGVQAMLSPAAYVSFSMAGMLSADGKCKTFDKRANGYVRGEGCGAIFIKTLAAAEADGNHIYAVIRGTAENHGGRVTTLTAPNSAAQVQLLLDAYEEAQIDPATVGYIECHGTGTSLGDPIEVQSLTKAFGELYKRHNKPAAVAPHCGLASVKTNIGHLETAAGIAGILKVLLALKHHQLPASLHLEEVNPYVNLRGTPFYIVDRLTPWNAPADEQGASAPRRAGVSSFGFGGANAHAVLEEYVPANRAVAPAEREPQVFVLSAKNEDRLRAYAESMRTYLERHEVNLADLTYTLQVGRDEMPERLAMVVSTVEELKEKLTCFLDGRERPPDSWRGTITSTATGAAPREASDGSIGELFERRDLAALAQRWVNGPGIDWRLLHDGAARRRVSLPTYPFAKERYWVLDNQDRSPASASQPVLHPLVHRNTSTLAEQKFSSRFSGDEFFLADHRVGAQKLLPGMAYLEIARAAADFSGAPQGRVIRHLTWERPLLVDNGAVNIEVSLSPVADEVKFVVRTTGGTAPIVHCTGTLAPVSDRDEPGVLDIVAIRARCSELTLSGADLYHDLNSAGLRLGRSFQVVKEIYANPSESLAILQLPEHLRSGADEFWLHPALMDGALHTAVGLMKTNEMDLRLSLPYSVREVQIAGPLSNLHYGYATWSATSRKGDGDHTRTDFYLLDKTGNVLVRLRDLSFRPLPLAHGVSESPRAVERERPARADRQEEGAGLQSLIPVWNRAGVRVSAQQAVPESTRVLLLGGDQARLEWVRASYPNADVLPQVLPASAAAIAEALADCTFDQLLWIAPDVDRDAGRPSGSLERMIDAQDEGVLTVFRIVKALLHRGYGSRKLQWTIVLGRTQRVIESDPVHPVHAAVVGLVGSLAKEYPQWDLRLLDVDSLASLSARECLSLPWDQQGNVLAHRHTEWFQQGLALLTAMPDVAPSFRRGGVYVVVGGAGGVGEVWSRFMIERHQAKIIWIGRRESNAAIEEKVRALSRLGPAPLYVSADAANVAALEEARAKILAVHPAVHGVVHSAIVLRDQTLARMDESAFTASLSAKVDVSVNIERVFGVEPLDFMLFFSSIISFVKSPGQSNYAAGCTFKDSFAQMLQQRRQHPVKIMNWGYWGNVGVVATDAYNRTMEQMGIGSIEPHDGMTALQGLIGSDLRQLAVIKTLSGQAVAGLKLSETITYQPQKISRRSARPQQAAAMPASRQPSATAATALV